MVDLLSCFVLLGSVCVLRKDGPSDGHATHAFKSIKTQRAGFLVKEQYHQPWESKEKKLYLYVHVYTIVLLYSRTHFFFYPSLSLYLSLSICIYIYT